MNNFVDPSVSGVVGRDTLPVLVWGLDVSPTLGGGQSQESDMCYQGVREVLPLKLLLLEL